MASSEIPIADMTSRRALRSRPWRCEDGQPGSAEHRFHPPLRALVVSARHQMVVDPKPDVDDREDDDDHDKAEEKAGQHEPTSSFPTTLHAGQPFP